MSFGEKLKMYRRSRNMTQEALAGRLGITSEHLSEIERGLSSTRIETLVKIIEELDLTQDEAKDLFVEWLIEKGVPTYVFGAQSE